MSWQDKNDISFKYIITVVNKMICQALHREWI